MEPLFSIVIPSRNAAAILQNCLNSLTSLDYSRDRFEIIIADGMSTDNTKEIAEKYNAKVVNNPGIRVVSARNVGFVEAKGDYIAFSDADCVMDSGWLRNSLKYFEDKKVACVGGPNLVPESDKPFARATGLIFDYAALFGAGAPTRVYGKIKESRAHGSNVIYRADVLRKILPVDEGVFEGEDVIMNQKIKELGYKLLYVPDVLVYHYRRTTIRKWWKQMYTYGLAKVLMLRKMKGTVTPVQLMLGFSVPLLIALLTLFLILNLKITLFITLGLLVLFILSTAIFALLKTRSLAVAWNMPLATFILPVAWSCGFLRELIIPSRRDKN